MAAFCWYCHIVDLNYCDNNVISLLYLLFPYELVHAFTPTQTDYLNDTCAHCHTIPFIGKHTRFRFSKKFCYSHPCRYVDTQYCPLSFLFLFLLSIFALFPFSLISLPISFSNVLQPHCHKKL